MSARRILVAGIGNVFLGDDGIGVEVARRLLERPWPPGVDVRDFGIRGFDLACALCDGPDAAVLVDAVSRGMPPGTLFVLDAGDAAGTGAGALDGHTLDPMAVLALARRLGELPARVLVVGCQPEDFGPPDEGRLGLSAPVAAAVDGAAALVADVVDALRAGRPIGEPSPAAGGPA